MSEVVGMGIVFEVEYAPKDFPDHLLHMEPIVKKEMRSYFKKLYGVGVLAAAAHTPKDTGKLRNSLFIGRRHSESYYSDEGFAIGSALEYAPVMDSTKRWYAEGVLQKTSWWPNVEELSEWVERRLHPPHDELYPLTYIVGEKLSRKGFPSHNFMLAAEMRVKSYMKGTSDTLLKNILKPLAA